MPDHATTLSPARILIVENDPLLSQVITLHVEALGHRVVAILASGEDVLEQGMALNPDLILMDIVLDGALDDPWVRAEALSALRACGYLDVVNGAPVGSAADADGAVAAAMRMVTGTGEAGS